MTRLTLPLGRQFFNAEKFSERRQLSKDQDVKINFTKFGLKFCGIDQGSIDKEDDRPFGQIA